MGAVPVVGMGLRVTTLLAILGVSHGQVTGAVCTKDASHPEGAPALCVPKFCKAPSPFNMKGKDEYTFTSEYNGVTYSVNFTPPDYLHGYDLAEICGDHITLANPLPQLIFGAPPSPPPPLYSSAIPKPPTGCAPISPLPTLMQSLDLDLLAVWIILIVYLFYALAMVCEEFLVPAINILCVKTGIPDDVAGATLLAAGCNSPEFFSSVIGIFIADSTVGVGTVIGSAPFNLCCITAGSALSLGGALFLDPWLMGRELIGLLIAILLFLLFMDDYRIMWWEALIMVLYYGFVYVPALANFDAIRTNILRCVAPQAGGRATMLGDEGGNALAIDFRTGASAKLSGRSDGRGSGEGMRPPPATGLRGQLAASLSHSLAETLQHDYSISAMKERQLSQRVPTDLSEQMSIELRPVAIPTRSARVRGDVENGGEYATLVEECRKRCDGYPNSEKGFAGVLMKKPRGFAKVRVRGILWQARYFVLDQHPTNPFRYSHADQTTKFVTVPLQSVATVSRVGLEELHLKTPSEIYKLRLPAGEPQETLQRWFDQLIVKIHDMGVAAPPPQELAGEMHEDHHEHPPWYAWPESTSGRVLHVLTFFIKAIVFTTTPNVLKKENEKYFLVTIGCSVIWLAIFALLMTDIIEYLGCGIGVSTTVIGLSLGAIGTSFPNLYASILVARAGQGGMAICQAIASNTFNICICLGLLWLLHTIGVGSCDYGSHGQSHGFCSGCYSPSGFTPLCPYFLGTNNVFGSSAGSTKGALIVSLIWVLGFLITLVVCKLHVRKIPAYLMFALYILYILYQFVAAYTVNSKTNKSPVNICFSSVNICI